MKVDLVISLSAWSRGRAALREHSRKNLIDITQLSLQIEGMLDLPAWNQARNFPVL
jgi:hypothetical protein